MAPFEKILMLGTAQWGWTVQKKEAFQVLDGWIGAGFLHIDCATNYPINRNPVDFRAAEKILQEYILAHGLQKLQITMKIGSLNNLRTPDVNLSPSFIQMITEEYLRVLGSNLSCVMIHWDNRENAAEIRTSLDMLQKMQQEHGIRPGLSGIAHPDIYVKANTGLDLSFDIQLKHNVLQSDFERYKPLTSDGNHWFFAYGLNAGGVKLEPPYPTESTFLARGGTPENVAPLLEKINDLRPVWNTAFVRPPVKTMNHVGLIYAGLHPDLQGILLGVSSAAQLHETLDFWRNFEVFDYSDVFSSLKKILLPAPMVA
ncbi:MAG: aldo/keto reductase [Saprospiraceae bacterium]